MARKEDVAQIAQKMMYQQNNIRNIGTVAHIDHGKCVSPETRLQLADGRLSRADELFETLRAGSTVAQKDSDRIVFDVSHKNFIVFSLNKETGEIEKKPVSHAWKLSGGKTVRVQL